MKDEIDQELNDETTKNLFRGISKAEKEEAIRYLMDNVPKDCLEKVWICLQNKEQRLSLALNLSFGIYIRNTLRKGSFNWGPLTLDALCNLFLY